MSASQVWYVIKDFPELDQVQIINQMKREGKILFSVQEQLLKRVCLRLKAMTLRY